MVTMSLMRQVRNPFGDMVKQAHPTLRVPVIGLNIWEMKLARFVQAGFWIVACAAMIITYFDLAGFWVIAGVIALGMPFSFAALYGLRCKNCGVSYYFDPNDWNITGVNLFVPVATKCRKCGAPR